MAVFAGVLQREKVIQGTDYNYSQPPQSQHSTHPIAQTLLAASQKFVFQASLHSGLSNTEITGKGRCPKNLKGWGEILGADEMWGMKFLFVLDYTACCCRCFAFGLLLA